MHPVNHPSSTKILVIYGDDYKLLAPNGENVSPIGEVEVAHSSTAPGAEVGPRLWQLLHQASHLFKCANGTWYVRLAVPAAIRP
jgi:hypothetical protein